MRSGAAWFFAVSLGAHVALGAALGSASRSKRTQSVAITFVDPPKPKAAPKIDPPPEPKPPVDAPVHPVRSKAAPPAAAKAAPQNAAASAAGDALPDFGLSLTGGGGGGLAVPVGGGGGPSEAPPPAVKRLGHAAASDECTEVAKPHLLSRPTPAYTDEARALGLSGKVRVEITIDERGRVTSVRLLQGLGHGLDESAIAAARGMTFEPAVRCGRASTATFKIGINFAPPVP